MSYNLNDETFNNYSSYSYTPKPPKKKKEAKFSLTTLLVAIVLSAAIGAGSSVVGFSVLKNNVLEQNNSNKQGNSITNINVEKTAENVIEAVAEKVEPSVVGIATTAATSSFFGGDSESVGEGSGVIYSSDGYIITNYHVIESAISSYSSKIEVYLTADAEKAYPATVVGYNISNDLAVIKINVTGLTAIELGEISKVSVGQYAIAIGSPGGLEFMGSVTSGIISGLNRVISDSSSGSEVNLIQTDAAINPGNSGGALVNTEGKLIGINSSKIAATEFEGMGFAIPVDTVVKICDKIIAKENDPNPYIGITISEKYDAETLKKLGYPSGAVVKSVISSGPAYSAGLRSGDIITTFNNKEVTDYSVLNDFVSETTPGNKVTVKFYRAGRYYTTNLEIGSNNSQ